MAPGHRLSISARVTASIRDSFLQTEHSTGMIVQLLYDIRGRHMHKNAKPMDNCGMRGLPT